MLAPVAAILALAARVCVCQTDPSALPTQERTRDTNNCIPTHRPKETERQRKTQREIQMKRSEFKNEGTEGKQFVALVGNQFLKMFTEI